MRPMTNTSADNVTGAFFPNESNLRAIDTVNRERTTETLVPSVRGVGLAAAYGTFINLAKTKWGVNRFFNTAPAAAFPLRPRLPNYAKQVQNPTMSFKMPGYENHLSMVQSQLGRLADKPYYG